MAPFTGKSLLSGFKERIESIATYSDRLYIGTATGSLNVYSLTKDTDGQIIQATFEDVKKGLTRRAIEQLGYIKAVNSLVVLSGETVTLFPSPAFVPGTLLPQAKGAMSFAIDTSIQNISDAPAATAPGNPPDTTDGSVAAAAAGSQSQASAASVITYLAVGCRKKIVIYTWKDGESQDVRELPLPHSPRSIVFATPAVLVLSYTAADHVLLKLPMMSVTELALPAPPPLGTAGLSAMSKGALSGLSGYMTLGLGAKAKPAVFRVSDDGEFAVRKDNMTTFFAPDGQISRTGAEWPGPPDETVFVQPYMISILPPGTVPAPISSKVNTAPTAGGGPAAVAATQLPLTYQVPTLQVISSLTLSTVQTIPFPFATPDAKEAPGGPQSLPPRATAVGTNTTLVRLLSPSPDYSSPLFLSSTPTDRTAATVEGTTIWNFTMQPWGEQLDEQVGAGQYADALTMLDTLSTVVLPDKEARRAHIRGLHAVSVFTEGKYAEAVKTFIDLGINPAKVVALYPESVAGRLSTPRPKWIELFGGKPPPTVTENPNTEIKDASGSTEAGQGQGAMAAFTDRVKATMDAAIPSLSDAIPSLGARDDDTRSVRSMRSVDRQQALSLPATARDKNKDDFARSVENLLVYLGDRRPKLSGALATFNITPAKAPELSTLSETSTSELFALPNLPLPSLTPEQLLRYAQIVDTALFKSYLIIRPSLVGSLCRLDNWCEVEEVEEVLKDRKKFSELIDLYRGKKMHAKALSLLKELSADESDQVEKVDPTVRYLQKLGPQYLPVVFEWSNWVLDASSTEGLKIFMSEDFELPRTDVANFLATKDPNLCARYIEHLLEEMHETDTIFHNRLAEIYLELTVAAKKRGDEDARSRVYHKLLDFIDTSTHYEADRVFSRLPSDDLFEARAILLGRLGKHEAALEIYVNRLQDYEAAERYCKRVYHTEPDPRGIFLTLLRIYLRPSPKATVTGVQLQAQGQLLLAPALDLISRHSPRLDAAETLQLLPPLVNAEDVRVFLIEALKTPKVDSRITKELWRARGDQIDRKLMTLQSKRVRVTDTRICPQCHKRLGNSVIAVHAPRGEVTHYQCREAFAKGKETK
ncbi:Vacuolar morphogenesis protein 6 [Tulasnella sp. JGI-2019a]|nr:Vacuolar morphogenesis protein 6 [Tulasnella sp. JGI-2019a]